MKFSPERIDAQSISGYGPGWVAVGGEKIHDSVILGAQGLRTPWPVPSSAMIKASPAAFKTRSNTFPLILAPFQRQNAIPLDNRRPIL